MTGDLLWLTAFLDLPASVWEVEVDFWRAVTGTGISPLRGDDGEFATLLPAAGTPFLRVQRVAEGGPGIHLDLHGRGAEVLDRRSPAGLPWCAVSGAAGERPPPITWAAGHASLVDQVCIDVLPEVYEAECAFWAATTGWELRATSAAEMRQLVRPTEIPLRILLQRREAGEPPATAHLDLATTDRAAEVDRHLALGGEIDFVGSRWTRLRDPGGMLYCVTDRDPWTGLLP